jgi:hypothetical protein
MIKKKASQIFGEVDPHLKVIDAGTRRRGPGKGTVKLSEFTISPQGPYQSPPLTEEQWDAAQGVKCPICGSETLRLYPYGFSGKRQACKDCIDRRQRILDHKANTAEYKGRLAAAKNNFGYNSGIL